ncbi:MAG: hypothetical protein AAF696_07060 [Bacteroidota bacterium]
MNKETPRVYAQILLSLFLCLITSPRSFSQTEIEHKIEIIHKGISVTEKVECSLIEVRNIDNEAKYFFMHVSTVVCGDSICRVDTVKLYWDRYARFERLVLPEEVELEKAEGKAFTKGDYEKLNYVLREKDSPLKDLFADQMVGTLSSEGVDAASRASISINKKDYVEGAVWTCYSLWHWVHGDTKEIIRDLSGDATSSAELISLLSSHEKELAYYAIEQLKRRKEYSTEIIEHMIGFAKESPDLLKKSLDYWEGAPNSMYKKAMRAALLISDKGSRLLCLRAILQSSQTLSGNFFLALPLSYESMTYQEIQLLLRILNKYAIYSPVLIESLFPLLDLDDFLIARRVYWYLTDQDLNLRQEKRLATFYNKWKKKL